jgi:hypothetical protein
LAIAGTAGAAFNVGVSEANGIYNKQTPRLSSLILSAGEGFVMGVSAVGLVNIGSTLATELVPNSYTALINQAGETLGPMIARGEIPAQSGSFAIASALGSATKAYPLGEQVLATTVYGSPFSIYGGLISASTQSANPNATPTSIAKAFGVGYGLAFGLQVGIDVAASRAAGEIYRPQIADTTNVFENLNRVPEINSQGKPYVPFDVEIGGKSITFEQLAGTTEKVLPTGKLSFEIKSTLGKKGNYIVSSTPDIGFANAIMKEGGTLVKPPEAGKARGIRLAYLPEQGAFFSLPNVETGNPQVYNYVGVLKELIPPEQSSSQFGSGGVNIITQLTKASEYYPASEFRATNQRGDFFAYSAALREQEPNAIGNSVMHFVTGQGEKEATIAVGRKLIGQESRNLIVEEANTGILSRTNLASSLPSYRTGKFVIIKSTAGPTLDTGTGLATSNLVPRVSQTTSANTTKSAILSFVSSSISNLTSSFSSQPSPSSRLTSPSIFSSSPSNPISQSSTGSTSRSVISSITSLIPSFSGSSTTSSTSGSPSFSPSSISHSVSPSSPSISPNSPPSTPISPSYIPSLSPSRKKGGNLTEGFRAFIIKKGKKEYLPGIGTQGEELLKGANYVRSTIRAKTFGIEDAGQLITQQGQGTNYTPPTDVFRNFRIKGGQRVALPYGEYIEKAGTRAEGYTAPGARLGTPAERAEISQARRAKRGGFRLL